jgi:hypothetical protein
MSGPAGHGPKGLMAQTSLARLEVAFREREEEAREMRRLGFHSTAAALRLYALEIRVKIAICKLLDLPCLPSACKTHDLSELIIFTGLWRELQDPSFSMIRENWDILQEYSKARLNDLRYQPRAELDPDDAAKIEAALDDPADGVLAWLSRRP